MDRWTENNLDSNQEKEEVAVQTVKEETLQWGLARVTELDERFGITSPALVARALGISIFLAEAIMLKKQSAGYHRS